MDRAALADFLRHRREALRPEDVALPPGTRRRTQGLRREEVASLAVMSTDYYTRLEQRRGPQPSAHMLASLARALRLTNDERDYLYRIAGHNAPLSLSGSPHVAPALLRVLDRLHDTPALILTDLGETLVQNAMAVALFGDASHHTGLARSAMYRWFTDPAERSAYPEADRERQSRAQVANLRAAHGLRGPQSQAGRLVRALEKESEEFAEMWARHEVVRRFEDHKTLIHPEVGAIELDCQALFTEDQSQTLLVLTAPPRTEGYEKLQLLAALGLNRFPPSERQGSAPAPARREG
ncbi:helix-turn-helix transcriptional regulator [Streptomyces sp. NBC_01335]|uniref:helix-turn-helix transcriptional regulator n=1 Tax=Streptomyces sp. NBC_01335 TaxID=2903828 RepID=UPI002E15EA5C|nr:helix-turn-helix transcriptional regulator [Streptomyces sp. NBC_01335]